MKTFSLADGAPMHLLSELGLHETFLRTIERHRREGLPLVLNRTGRTEMIPADQLADRAHAARERIAELEVQIAAFNQQFSLNEQPPAS